jgi:hypothetical protein
MENEQQRALVRDPNIGKVLTAAEPLSSKSPAAYLRAFAWVANEDVPAVFQPLLRSYLSLTAQVLRDPRDVIFVSHILSYVVSSADVVA